MMEVRPRSSEALLGFRAVPSFQRGRGGSAGLDEGQVADVPQFRSVYLNKDLGFPTFPILGRF